MSHPLDRPIWAALNDAHASFAHGDAHAKRYPVEISPLAAARDASPEALAALISLIPPGENVTLLEPKGWPQASAGVATALGGLCVQMHAPSLTAGGKGFALEALGEVDAEDMLALATLTRPGPFKLHTHKLGRFLGVRQHGVLIAMAGERTRSGAFIEVSAVCTHPDHRGRGLGAALIRAACDRILSEHKTPYLHSYASNDVAIGLYRSLGFEVQREVQHSVWQHA